MKRILTFAIASLTIPAFGQNSISQFEVLLSVLPGDEGENAQLAIPTSYEGHHSFRIVRNGNGRFICFGDEPGDDRFSPSCFHRALQGFMLLERRLKEEGLVGEAYRERQCEEIESGRVKVPRQAIVFTVSATRTPDGSIPKSVTVYRLLQMPGATAESTGLPEEAPDHDLPYLHNGGTCDAHLMWSTVESTRRAQ